MVEQATHVLAHQVRFQGPGRVGVTKHQRHVGHIAQHHALIDQGFTRLHRLAIDSTFHATQHLNIQTGRSNDDIRLQLLAGFKQNPGFGKPLDVVGYDLGLTATQRLEQIAIGHGTQTLVPRIVAGAEVGHIHVITQLTLGRCQQGSAHQLGTLLG